MDDSTNDAILGNHGGRETCCLNWHKRFCCIEALLDGSIKENLVGLLIPFRKTRRIKSNRTKIIGSKLMNRYEIMGYGSNM